MRFLKDGSDIPDDLIRASMTGEVLFLCGAGVSIRVGLPSFEGLTNDLYAKLGETPDNEAAEKIACGRQEYDRALRSLEKRTHRPGTGISRVREETVKLLETPKDAELPDHLTLLKLSRDKEGRPRLLTTNFDTLFERAAIKGGLDAVSSHANKSLPKPGGPRDYGVLHLHGRISDKTLSLEETDIVLTSADFGDAYLRDGWASQYIEDRIRLTPLVLVGYRAEDTALRLLLETLDVDRERFSCNYARCCRDMATAREQKPRSRIAILRTLEKQPFTTISAHCLVCLHKPYGVRRQGSGHNLGVIARRAIFYELKCRGLSALQNSLE